jgi:hypothetical protein
MVASKIVRSVLERMWTDGVPVEEIAAHFEVNTRTLGEWRRRFGLPSRTVRPVKRKVTPLPPRVLLMRIDPEQRVNDIISRAVREGRHIEDVLREEMTRQAIHDGHAPRAVMAGGA